MSISTNLRIVTKAGMSLFAISILLLAGCGGGGGASSTTNTAPTATEVAAITARQISSYSSEQIKALGLNIKYLSNDALAALADRTYDTSNRIDAITAAQITTFTPAQIRLIGAATTGSGGVLGHSQINYLNAAAFAALVSDPAQVAAITTSEINTFTGAEIAALGVNINYLSNDALAALSATSYGTLTPQIYAITAAQIVTLTPAQIRLIGAATTGSGGVLGHSQISNLNAAAFAALVSDPAQVAAITPSEVETFSGSEIVALGTNISSLSNAALNILSPLTSFQNSTSQIHSITAVQIAALSTAQIRQIGAYQTYQHISSVRLKVEQI